MSFVCALLAAKIDSFPGGIGRMASRVMYSSSTSTGSSWSTSSSLSIFGKPSSADTYVSILRMIQKARRRVSRSIGLKL